ncbi:MAG: hypothetical protein WAW37_06930 [Syntrophobacteraceae bacterium]
MLCPIAAKPVAEPDKVRRDVMCHLYDECLDIAISADWENFSCSKCSLYMQTKRPSDKWLDENTFKCKLGRVTPVQCKVNREKPDVLEKHPGLKSGLDQRDWYKRNRIYIASVCAACKDWERLCNSLLAKPSIESGAVTMADKHQSDEQPIAASSMRICGCCGKEFQPYQHGITFIKKTCRECLVKKINRKKGVAEVKQKAPALRPASNSTDSETVFLLFARSDEQLLKRIRELSLRERRTVESQILYWLERHVPELKSITGAQ